MEIKHFISCSSGSSNVTFKAKLLPMMVMMPMPMYPMYPMPPMGGPQGGPPMGGPQGRPPFGGPQGGPPFGGPRMGRPQEEADLLEAEKGAESADPTSGENAPKEKI